MLATTQRLIFARQISTRLIHNSLSCQRFNRSFHTDFSKYPLYYTKTHEYVRLHDKNIVHIGLSNHAVEKLGEIVYIDLNDANTLVKTGEVIARLESVKSVGEIYTPVSGKITALNPEMSGTNEKGLKLLNSDPEGDGWLCHIEIENHSQICPSNKALLTKKDYEELCEKEDAEEEEEEEEEGQEEIKKGKDDGNACNKQKKRQS